MGPTHSMIVKGLYLFGRSLQVPVMWRFFPSSQTLSPVSIWVIGRLSRRDCCASRFFWTSCLASSRSFSLMSAAGVFPSISCMLTWGLVPVSSSCGEWCVVLFFQELWVNSATGSNLAQLFCHPEVYGLRYCSIQAFIRSVCPSVLGWNVVDWFYWTPNALQITLEKFDVKRGSQSDMMCFRTPNQGTRCFRYSWATPGPSIVLLQGMNLAAFKHPWSTIISMLSKPSDLGRSVMRSMDMYWNGPSPAGTLKCCSGAFLHGRFVLDSWHLVHPLMYCSMKSRSLGPM